MRVKLGRAPIRKNGPSVLDTTVKSARGVLRQLAPRWEMVLGHKSGALSDDEYTQLYNAILEEVPEATWLWLHRTGMVSGGELLLGCYCPSSVFCHTKLIVRWACQRYSRLFENNLEEDSNERRDSSGDGDTTAGHPAQTSGQDSGGKGDS